MSETLQSPKRIVFLGASSVEGQVDPEQGGFVGRFQKWYGAQSQRHHIFNLGISGDTVPHMLQRLENEVTARRAHLIVIQTGSNDSSRVGGLDQPCTTDLEKYQTNVAQLFTKAQHLAPVISVSVHPCDDTRTQPVWWGDIYYTLADLTNYAAVVKTAAARHQIPHLDFFNEWLSWPSYQHFIAKDGLHANDKGHHWMFEQFRDFFVERYGLST